MPTNSGLAIGWVLGTLAGLLIIALVFAISHFVLERRWRARMRKKYPVPFRQLSGHDRWIKEQQKKKP